MIAAFSFWLPMTVAFCKKEWNGLNPVSVALDGSLPISS